MCLKPDAEKVSKKIYLQDEYSAKNLAAPLAECNDIVKEEFEYQPGADLSRRDVLGIYFTVYPRAGSNEKLGFYYLNGKDDEDAVYRELMKLINGEDLNAYTKRNRWGRAVMLFETNWHYLQG